MHVEGQNLANGNSSANRGKATLSFQTHVSHSCGPFHKYYK